MEKKIIWLKLEVIENPHEYSEDFIVDSLWEKCKELFNSEGNFWFSNKSDECTEGEGEVED